MIERRAFSAKHTPAYWPKVLLPTASTACQDKRGPVVEADSVIWTARLRIGRVMTFRASVSRAFRAAALAALVDLVEEDSAVLAAADSGVDNEN